MGHQGDFLSSSLTLLLSMAIFFIYYGVKSKALVDELYLEIEFTLTRSELYKKQNG